MKTSLMLAVALAVVAVGLNQAGYLPAKAEAAPKYAGTLMTDGGATGTTFSYCAPTAGAVLQLQNMNDQQYAYNTCVTAPCAPSPTLGYRPNAPQAQWQQNGDGGLDFALLTQTFAPRLTDKIEMGLDKCIQATTLDAGVITLRVFTITSNPK